MTLIYLQKMHKPSPLRECLFKEVLVSFNVQWLVSTKVNYTVGASRLKRGSVAKLHMTQSWDISTRHETSYCCLSAVFFWGGNNESVKPLTAEESYLTSASCASCVYFFFLPYSQRQCGLNACDTVSEIAWMCGRNSTDPRKKLLWPWIQPAAFQRKTLSSAKHNRYTDRE